MSEATESPAPWYRQFWPWVLIAIPLSAVIMGAVTLWLALSNPDYLVVEQSEYEQIRSGLRAQDVPTAEPDDPEAENDGKH